MFFWFHKKYFVDIFSEPPNSLLTNKFRNGSIFHKSLQINRPCVSFKICMASKDNSVSKVLKNLRVIFFYFLDYFFNFFFGFCNVFFLSCDLSAGFIKTKITKPTNKIWGTKNNLLKKRKKNHIAGPRRSQYLFENIFLLFSSNLAKLQWKDC